jgi:hypothetical protein
MRSLLLALDIIRLVVAPDDLSRSRCPACLDALTLHQPDEMLPDRLLGTCGECHAWFLIDATAELMVRLPDEQALRDA